MNWIDITILVIIGASLVWGLRSGIIPMAFVALGMIVGWWVAGQNAEALGGVLGDLIGQGDTFDTALTMFCSAVIVSISVFAITKIGALAKPFIVIGTLGTASMADKLGGLAVGLIVGLAISCLVIMGLARLSFDLEVSTPDVPVPGGAAVVSLAEDKIATITDRRQELVDSMKESFVVRVFLKAADVIPGDALGFIPGDFKASLDILREEIG